MSKDRNDYLTMFLSLVTQGVPFLMAIVMSATFTIPPIVRVLYQRLVRICSIPSSYREGCIRIICLEGCWAGKECQQKA